jgi:methylphosphotriester-DNA--protein-cysteine methyltransferase
MSRAVEERNRRLLRARDAIDRTYAQPLDVATLARVAHVSPAHFIRTFRAIVGEPPTAYRRRAPALPPAPTCVTMSWMRPSSFGEARPRDVD